VALTGLFWDAALREMSSLFQWDGVDNPGWALTDKALLFVGIKRLAATALVKEMPDELPPEKRTKYRQEENFGLMLLFERRR
jgi:hypothetical protein